MSDERLSFGRFSHLVLAGVIGLMTTGRTVAEEDSSADSPRKPNIVYILADDLGYGDLGCYGQETIPTPNLDRLAAEGMRFTDHYAGHTVCRPSRLTLMLGQHTGHTPISSNAGYTLKPGARTLITLLEDAGYATGGVGKWALGRPGTTGMPTSQGFDFWFGYLHQSNAHNYYPEFLWRNGEKVRLPGNEVGEQPRVSVKRTTYSHDLFTREAADFIRRHAERPFTLQVHYTIPHANNEGGRATGNGMEVPDHGPFKDRDWPETEKGFAAMIARLDRDVGRLVALLRELDLEQDTVVFFTSDNGPHQEGGHKMEFFDSNGPLRGYKRDLYEGGIRVPLIVWWPETIEAGSVSDHPSAFWDVLPTVCDIAGVEPPGDTDGLSFLPELLGKPQKKHDSLYWQFRGKVAVRRGRWKAVRPGQNKPLELYDLRNDVGEGNNVADEHPDVLEEMKRTIRNAAGEEGANDSN